MAKEKNLSEVAIKHFAKTIYQTLKREGFETPHFVYLVNAILHLTTENIGKNQSDESEGPDGIDENGKPLDFKTLFHYFAERRDKRRIAGGGIVVESQDLLLPVIDISLYGLCCQLTAPIEHKRAGTTFRGTVSLKDVTIETNLKVCWIQQDRVGLAAEDSLEPIMRLADKVAS